jgi:hypothetical protein
MRRLKALRREQLRLTDSRVRQTNEALIAIRVRRTIVGGLSTGERPSAVKKTIPKLLRVAADAMGYLLVYPPGVSKSGTRPRPTGRAAQRVGGGDRGADRRAAARVALDVKVILTPPCISP